MKTQLKLKYSRITIAVLSLMLMGFGYHSYSVFQDKKKEIAFFENEKQLYLNEIKEMTSRYDSAKLENSLRIEEVDAYKRKIEALQEKIKNSENSFEALLILRDEMNLVKDERDRLISIANKLRRKNDSLVVERDSAQNLYNKQKVISSGLARENGEYEEIIDKASALQAASFRAYGIKFRNSGSISETSRARRVQSIRVNFVIAANIFADSGDKDIYVQILDPQKNNIIGLNKHKKFKSGLNLHYSHKESITYENKAMEVSLFVDTGEEKLKKGSYFISVFYDDMKLGSTDLLLK